MATATAPAPSRIPSANGEAAAKPKPVAGVVASAVATTFDKIAKKGQEELLKVKDVLVFKKLQARTDTDSGSVVDEGRSETFAKAMKDGAKFPPIKVMKVMDSPGHKDEEVYVCWDGMHTLRGKEIAKLPDVDALVWSGTWAQAQFLAATRANREHEENGKPLSSKDKIHAVAMYARVFLDSEIPKKEWPSNREAADLIGCSRQLVNDMDPFERGKGDVREAKAAAKRGSRLAADATTVEIDTKGHYSVVDKNTQEVVGKHDAANEAGAIATHLGYHKAAKQDDLVARKEVTAAATKPGSEKPVGFDWVGMDSHLGYLARGLEGCADLFGLKGTPEFKDAVAHLNAFATQLYAFRKKHGSKKPAAKAE